MDRPNKAKLRSRELNPGLPRDRRKYLNADVTVVYTTMDQKTLDPAVAPEKLIFFARESDCKIPS